MTATGPLLEVTREDGAFRLSGELDLSNVDQLALELASEVREGNELVLDCTDLRFVDSTGMAALLRISRVLGSSGRLVMRMVTPPVAKTAHVLGLDRLPNLELTGARPAPGVAAG